MPKNIFQRPPKPTNTRNVPRHGAPIPARKPETKVMAQPAKQADTQTSTLPPLEVLLKNVGKP